MLFDERRLIHERLRDGHALIEVLLATVQHTNIAVVKADRSTEQNVSRIRSGRDQINFRHNADRAATLLVNLSCEVEGIRIGHVIVRRQHGEDDGALLLNIPQRHVSS